MIFGCFRPVGRLPVAALVLAMLLTGSLPAFAQEKDFEPEEPSFAFIANSPYTQQKNSLQLTSANNFTRHLQPGVKRNEFSSMFNAEWGFTDRLQGDLSFGYGHVRETGSGLTPETNSGVVDMVLGLRYRFLEEKRWPVTLTMGPQLIIPTGNTDKGMGNGKPGFAWDVSLGKEWNRYFFHFVSVNYSLTPSVSDPTPGSGKRFTLNNLAWGVTLGFRPLKKDTATGGYQDLHLLLEGGGTWEQEAVEGNRTGRKRDFATVFVSPGIRYGYQTAGKFLMEAGVAVPIGLNRETPDWGVIFRLQIEFPPIGSKKSRPAA